MEDVLVMHDILDSLEEADAAARARAREGDD